MELARRKLLNFTLYTFPEYEVNWHHELLCRYLDLWAKREIPRLMVFMPPRHGKSELVSRRLPAKMLGDNPDLQVIATSYGASLARRMNRDVQRIIDGQKYHQLYPETRLYGKNIRTVAQDTYLRNSDLFEVVNHKGHYISAGVGGALTGMGGDALIIDDPIKNAQEAKSPVVRQAIKEWYTTTFRTRAQKGAAILITQTRWHEADLSGWLLEMAKENPSADQWTILSLPALKEGDPTDIDPRQDGEALWPSHYSREWLLTTKATSQQDEWDALYQQTPSSPAGSVFKRLWWTDDGRRFDWHDQRLVNSCIGRWISIDTANKDKEENDKTAYTVGELRPDYRLMVRRVEDTRLDFPELVDEIPRLAHRYNADGKLRGILVEDKASGTSALQTLAAAAPDWISALLIPFLPTTSKVERARQAGVWCANGSVLLPIPDLDLLWLPAFEDQLFSFPVAAHDDMVDSFTQLVLYLEHILEDGFRARGGGKTNE